MEEEYNLKKIQNAPILPKEDFLFELQTRFDELFTNVKTPKELEIYQNFLKSYGYDCEVLKDFSLAPGKGRYVLGATKSSPQSRLDLDTPWSLAGKLGQSIEDLLDESLERNLFSSNVDCVHGKKLFDKINYLLDDLKKSGLPLEVYSYYVELYNSFVESESKGFLGSPEAEE